MAEREQLISQALENLDLWFSLRRRDMCKHPVHHDVSLPQMHILMMLLERGRMTVSEVATLFTISAPSASAIIDRMQEHGLVARERDQTDRRVVHVSISDRGRAVVDGMMGMQRDRVQRLLETMTDEELMYVVRGMDAVGRAFERSHNATENDQRQAG